MNRRTFVRTGAVIGIVGSVALAGCTQLFTTGSQYAPPIVENRPNAVYIPSHEEGIEMAGMSVMSGTNNNSSMRGVPGMDSQTGTLRCALTYSYPHRFWTVTGSDTEKVSIASDDTLHLMMSIWDPRTFEFEFDYS